MSIIVQSNWWPSPFNLLLLQNHSTSTIRCLSSDWWLSAPQCLSGTALSTVQSVANALLQYYLSRHWWLSVPQCLPGTAPLTVPSVTKRVLQYYLSDDWWLSAPQCLPGTAPSTVPSVTNAVLSIRVTSSVINNFVRAKMTLLGLFVYIYTFEETHWNVFSFL